MTYTEALTELSSTYSTEIEAHLDTARRELDEARAVETVAERHVHALEWLLSRRDGTAAEIEGSPEAAASSAQLTLHAAMHKVLKESPTGRLRAGEIIAEIDRRGLYRMRDGRVPESQQIHARAGHYPDMFGKEGSYFFAR